MSLLAVELLTSYPTLIVADDIDTVEGEGEDAIQFLVFSIPELTRSKVLVTSRRALFGIAELNDHKYWDCQLTTQRLH